MLKSLEWSLIRQILSAKCSFHGRFMNVLNTKYIKVLIPRSRASQSTIHKGQPNFCFSRTTRGRQHYFEPKTEILQYEFSIQKKATYHWFFTMSNTNRDAGRTSMTVLWWEQYGKMGGASGSCHENCFASLRVISHELDSSFRLTI